MRRAVATMGLLTLLLAGCGGDSDDAAPGAGPTTTAAAATPGSVDTDFTGQDSERFCELLRTYNTRFEGLGITDPTQLKALATEAEAALREAVALAPAEVKGDVNVVAAASTGFFKVLAQANYDFTRVTPDALAGLQTPEVQASTQRLGAYGQKVCGLTQPPP